jgi:hypothetical protein
MKITGTLLAGLQAFLREEMTLRAATITLVIANATVAMVTMIT